MSTILSGLYSEIPSPVAHTGAYYYATDQDRYYLASGENWVASTPDLDNAGNRIAPDGGLEVHVTNFPPPGAIIGGNQLPVKVDGSQVTQPVSGTFWPATQPVSGTVGVNSLPALPAGTNQIGNVTTQPITASLTMAGGTTSGTIGTATTLLAAASATKTLTVQNTSTTATIYVGTAATPTSTNSINIGPGVGYQFPVIPTNALNVSGNSASVPYVIWYA